MLFAGLTVVLDLRLLGLALTRVPVTDISDRLLPWTKVGFAVMIVTGILLSLRTGLPLTLEAANTAYRHLFHHDYRLSRWHTPPARAWSPGMR